MGREFKYKDYVEKDKIDFKGDLNKNIRYLLKVPLKNTGEKVLVIMKNPSEANREKADLTIDRLLKFCNSEGYSEVIIMNLFCYYSPDPKGIAKLVDTGKLLEAIGLQTDEILKNVLKEVNEVIVAWGGNSINRAPVYKSRIEQVTRLIQNKKLYYVQSVSKNTYYPRHPQTWAVNREPKIEKYKWTPRFL